MTEKQFEYYTSIKTSLTEAERKTIANPRYVELEELARADVDAARKIRDKSTFKSDPEYKLYLLCIIEFAHLKKLGMDISSLEGIA